MEKKKEKDSIGDKKNMEKSDILPCGHDREKYYYFHSALIGGMRHRCAACDDPNGNTRHIQELRKKEEVYKKEEGYKKKKLDLHREIGLAISSIVEREVPLGHVNDVLDVLLAHTCEIMAVSYKFSREDAIQCYIRVCSVLQARIKQSRDQ